MGGYLTIRNPLKILYPSGLGLGVRVGVGGSLKIRNPSGVRVSGWGGWLFENTSSIGG